MKFYCILLIILLSTALEANRVEEEKFVQEFQAYMQHGDYNKAVVLAKKIIVYTEKKPSSEEREVTLSGMYLKLSELYLYLRKKEKAMFWLLKLAKVDNQYIYPAHKNKLLKLFTALGEKMYDRGDYNKSFIYMNKAYELSTELQGKDSSQLANIGARVGNLYYQKGEYEKAFDVTEMSYEVLMKKSPNDTVKLSTMALNVGTYLMLMGEYDSALSYQVDTLKKMKKYLASDNKTIASIYNTIALTYIKQGDYLNAEAYLTHALKIKTEEKQNDESLVKIYSHFAMMYQEFGNIELALEFYEKSVNLYAQLGLHDRSIQRNLYSNIALAYIEVGKTEEGLKYYNNTLKLLDDNHIDTAYIYSNIGMLYTVSKQYDKAEKYLKDALQIKTKYLKTTHPSVAYTYLNLANLYEKKQLFEKALAYENRALKLLKHNGDTQETLYLKTYTAMASTYMFLENIPKAYENIAYAMENFLKIKENAYVVLSQKEKHNFKNSYQDLLSAYFSIAYAYIETLEDTRKNETIQKVFSIWVLIKYSIAEVSDQFRRLALKDAKMKDEVETLFRNQRSLARSYQTNYESIGEKRQSIKEIKKLKEKIKKSEKILSRKLKEYHMASQDNSANFSDLDKQLADKTAYLDFVKTDTNYYLFTMRNHANFTFVKFDNNETLTLDNYIRAIHDEVKKISRKEHFPDLDLAYTQYGALYETLISKINMKETKKLVISPDGLLNLLPFEVLYDRKNKQFFMEQMYIQYVSSAKELDTSEHSESVKTNDIVIFANPNFDANVSASKTLLRGNILEALPKQFYALPGTKKEANTIHKIFSSAKLFLEENATETELLKVKSPKILHIATHGFFLKDFNTYSALMKNGIVLNAANTTIREKEGEGIVTGLELAGLSLQGTELVVLSSCYSGLGDIENSEGMIGLGDAFKKAGAKNVLTSLWAVQDELGGNMMQLFYENIKNKKNYVEALRDAKVEMLEEGYMHPYYWGGFLLHGKGR